MGNPPQGPYGRPPSGQPTPMQAGDFTPAVKNFDICDLGLQIGAGTALYVTPQDFIEVNTTSLINNVNFLMAWRMLKTNGQVVHGLQPFTYTGAGSGQAIDFQCSEGWLVSVTLAISSPAVPTGACNCQVFLRRAEDSSEFGAYTLIQANINTFYPVCWPGTGVRNPTDGQGFQTNRGVSNPAAGADWSFTFNAGQRHRFIGCMFQLVTDATVGSRSVRLQLSNGGGTLYQSWGAGFLQAPSTTTLYTFSQGGAFDHTDPANVAAPLPVGISTDVSIASALGTNTTGKGAGDQFSGIIIREEQWHEND